MPACPPPRPKLHMQPTWSTNSGSQGIHTNWGSKRLAPVSVPKKLVAIWVPQGLVPNWVPKSLIPVWIPKKLVIVSLSGVSHQFGFPRNSYQFGFPRGLYHFGFPQGSYQLGIPRVSYNAWFGVLDHEVLGVIRSFWIRWTCLDVFWCILRCVKFVAMLAEVVGLLVLSSCGETMYSFLTAFKEPRLITKRLWQLTKNGPLTLGNKSGNVVLQGRGFNFLENAISWWKMILLYLPAWVVLLKLKNCWMLFGWVFNQILVLS